MMRNTRRLLNLFRLKVVPSTSARCVHKKADTDSITYEYATKNSKRTKRIYCWGRGDHGALGLVSLNPQLGTAPHRFSNRPNRLKIFDEKDISIKHVRCGLGYSLFLSEKHGNLKMYGCGVNTDSQMGYQPLDSKSKKIMDYIISPVEISVPLRHPNTTKVIDVSCGRAHTLVVTDNEGVYSMGHNGYGQCGRQIVHGEDYRGSHVVHRIVELTIHDVKRSFCGMDHSLFLTRDGQVWACGFGTDFQTGLGRPENVSIPELVEGDIKGERITQISSKGDTTLALSSNGLLFGWGNNEYDQLGPIPSELGSMVSSPVNINLKPHHIGRITKIASANTMTAILDEEGQVHVWGFGILGVGPKVDQSRKPQMIPQTLFGQNELSKDSRVVDIDAGINYIAALTNTGDVYTWGKNLWGQLGLGHRDDQFFPFKVALPAEATHITCGSDHMITLSKSFA